MSSLSRAPLVRLLWLVLLAASLASLPTPMAAQVRVLVAPSPPVPTVPTLLDSAALHAALARLPGMRAEKRVAHVFRIAFDSTGAPKPPVAVVPAAMPAAYREAVAPLLTAALRPIAPRLGGWETLLLVEAGAAPRIEFVELPQRSPSVANLAVLGDHLYEAAQRMMRADGTLAGTQASVRLSLRVGEDGRAADPRIASSSGIPKVDEAALGAVPTMRFRPALIDGEPVPSRVVLPVRFVFERDDDDGKKTRPSRP